MPYYNFNAIAYLSANTFTGAQSFISGSAGAPGIAAATDATTGFQLATAIATISISAVRLASFTPTGATFAQPLKLGANSDAPDVSLSRLAASVFGATSWIQNTGGEAALAANFTKANATLGATNLSLTVIAGRSYRIHGVLQVSNSTASEGVQIAFDGGSATATTFFMSAVAVGSVVAGTQSSTTLAGVMNYTTITGTDYIVLDGFLKVNGGGTFILRAAENTTATGTMTMGAGSWVALYDTVAL